MERERERERAAGELLSCGGLIQVTGRAADGHTMRRLYIGDKILLYRNVHYILLYLVIVIFIILYKSDKLDHQIEQMRKVWIVTSGETP